MIRTSKHVKRCLFATLVCSQMLGCAHLEKPPTQRTDTVILRSFKEDRTDAGQFVITNLNLKNDRLRANIQREKLCYSVNSNQIQNQKVQTYESKNVGYAILSGLAVSAGSGLLLAAAPDMSSEGKINDKGEEEPSTQAVAIAFGVIGSLIGIGAIANGIVVFSESGDRPLQAPWTTTEERFRSPQELCGMTSFSKGSIQFINDNQIIGIVETSSSDIDIDVRQVPNLCASPELLGKSTEISYFPAGSEEHVGVAKIDLDACIYATEIQRRITEAQTKLGSVASPMQFATLVASMGYVGEMLELLSRNDRDLEQLSRSHQALERDMTQKSGTQLTASLKDHARLIKTDKTSDAMAAAFTSLELSRLVEDTRVSTWQTVYGDYVRMAKSAPIQRLPDLVKLLRADAYTTTCMADTLQNPDAPNNEACPAWLDRELVHETFFPLQTALVDFVNQHINQLNKISGNLVRQPTERGLSELKKHFDAANEAQGLCHPAPWHVALKAPCAALGESRETAISAVNQSQAGLRKIQVQNTAKQWRNKFPQCRKVNEAAQAFQKLNHCDAACMKIRDRVIKDYNDLDDFEPENETWDDAALSKVRSECRAAGCPSCP